MRSTSPTPSAANETAVAAKVLWEFPNKDTPADVVKNIGFAFSRPIIIKHEQTTFSTDASGEEVATRSGEGWVVLVSSGYNNGDTGDGRGYLFMLDAKTGKLLKTLSTGVGSSSDPSGLGQLSAWADNDNISSTMRWVYGGDLKGNLWRFDPYTDAVTLLASLKDGSGNAQPISSAPELTRIKSSRRRLQPRRGRYGPLPVGDSDIPDMAGSSSSAIQTQSMYVIADSIGSAGFTTITRANLTKRTLTSLSNGKRALDSPAALDWSKTKGWYFDLNIRGERVDTDPAIAQTTLVFATNVPNSDPCIPGGSSHLFTLATLVTGSYVVGEDYVGESLGKALGHLPGADQAAERQDRRPDPQERRLDRKPRGGNDALRRADAPPAFVQGTESPLRDPGAFAAAKAPPPAPGAGSRKTGRPAGPAMQKAPKGAFCIAEGRCSLSRAHPSDGGVRQGRRVRFRAARERRAPVRRSAESCPADTSAATVRPSV